MSIQERIENWCLKPITAIQSLGKRIAATRQRIKEAASEESPSSAVMVLGVAAFFLVTCWLFFDEFGAFSGDSGAKLQAIATVFGNALGVLGAVIGVIILIGHEKREGKNLTRKIEKAIGDSIIAKLGIIDHVYDLTDDSSKEPNPSRVYVREASEILSHVSWADIEGLKDVFYKVDVLVPYSFSQLKLRESKILKVLKRINDLPPMYPSVSRGDAELIHLCQSEYVFSVLLLASRCRVDLDDWVHKKYPKHLYLKTETLR